MRDVYLTRSELGELLGLEERQIFRLVKDGKLSDGTSFPSKMSGTRRTFPRSRCLQWYIRYKQEEAIERAGSRGKPATMQDAELRKAIAEAEIAEMKLAGLRSEMVPHIEHRKELERILSRVAARFVGSGGEFAPRIVAAASQGPIDMLRATELVREDRERALAELQRVGRSGDESADDANEDAA